MRNKQDRTTALLMLTPTFILLGLFVYGLLGKTVFYSLGEGDSYADILEAFAPRALNSVTLVTTSTLLCSILGSLNGYVLSKWHIKGENGVFPLILFAVFVPYQALLIPLFEFMHNLNVYEGIPHLVVVHTIYGLPITTLIFRNFYLEIPDELREAAAVDGAGFFEIYARIILPLSASAFVVVVIWQFTQIWNEFLFALTLTAGASEPITGGLARGGETSKWNLAMVGAVVAALPPVLVYIIMSRYFVRGLLAGAIKI